jgi:hypothetical protein
VSPAPVCVARESRREQHINAFPKRSTTLQKLKKNPSADADLPPVLRERQSVMVLSEGRLAGVVVPLPQVNAAIPAPARFLGPAPEAC